MTIAQALVITSLWLSLFYLLVVAGTAIVAALGAGGRREDRVLRDEAVSGSVSDPVSIIVPLTGDAASVSQTITGLLDLNYPAFEVIVVGDGTAPAQIEDLSRDWQLEAREFFYRQALATANVKRIFRSAVDPRLMVIDKARGGYGDTLNCGVNVARYRYVVSVAPGIAFDNDALLRVMAAALRDPAHVVGASNHVELGADLSGASMGSAFQRLTSLRSLMNTRLTWRYRRCGLGPNGAVVVWRRDGVIKVDGFSRTAADADLDMMFRLQAEHAELGGRFARSGDVFGCVPSQTTGEMFRTAGRRQVAALQVLRAMLSLRGTALRGRTLAHFVESEMLTPLAQLWVVAATVGGAAAGWFSWAVPVLVALLLSFGRAAVTSAALLLRGFAAGGPEEPELRRLLLMAPLEFLLYRPLLAVARLGGVLAFVTSR
jgi:hypothetical protein